MRRDAQHMLVTGAWPVQTDQPLEGQMALVAPQLNEMLEGRQLHVVLCVPPPRHVNRPPPRLYTPHPSTAAARAFTGERQKLGVAALVEKSWRGETDA